MYYCERKQVKTGEAWERGYTSIIPKLLGRLKSLGTRLLREEMRGRERRKERRKGRKRDREERKGGRTDRGKSERGEYEPYSLQNGLLEA